MDAKKVFDLGLDSRAWALYLIEQCEDLNLETVERLFAHAIENGRRAGRFVEMQPSARDVFIREAAMRIMASSALERYGVNGPVAQSRARDAVEDASLLADALGL